MLTVQDPLLDARLHLPCVTMQLTEAIAQCTTAAQSVTTCRGAPAARADIAHSRAAVHGCLQGVRDINFSNDGRRFLSSSYDRVIKLWDTETGQVIRSVGEGKMFFTAKFHPDDDKQNVLMAGCQDKKVYQWDMNTGDLVQVRVQADKWSIVYVLNCYLNLLSGPYHCLSCSTELVPTAEDAATSAGIPCLLICRVYAVICASNCVASTRPVEQLREGL